MKVFFIIIGAFIALGGLLILIVNPIAGILFALLGIAFIVFGIKYRKEEPAEISSISYQEAITQSSSASILVAGFDHYQPALKSLLTEHNPDYDISKSEWLDYYGYDLDDRIYEYEIAEYELHLEAEPDNPYDPNAVKVYADETFIGYLPRGGIAELSEYSKIENVKAHVEIFGGRYKYLDHDEDYLDSYDDKYLRVKTDSTPVKARICFEW